MSPSLSDLRLGSLSKNLRYTFRMLRKMPGLTVTILLSLGIGIGVLTATFTIGYITILTPLPYPDPGQLMVVWSKVNTFQNVAAAADFLDWRQQNHTFQHMTALTNDTFNISPGD